MDALNKLFRHYYIEDHDGTLQPINDYEAMLVGIQEQKVEDGMGNK